MDLGLKGKKVILTGGSRGLGRAALDLFAQEGCDVAFFSRSADQVAETVAALQQHGARCSVRRSAWMIWMLTRHGWSRRQANWVASISSCIMSAHRVRA